MEHTPILIFYYVLTGICSGLVGGMLGLGGGIICVPVLYYLFSTHGVPEDIVMQMAVTTSLATIIIPAIFTSYVHHRKGAVFWNVAMQLSLGMVVGVIIGTFLINQLSSPVLRTTFGIFEILVATFIILKINHCIIKPEYLNCKIMNFSGILIGLISTFLGIGGGTLTIPILLMFSIPIRNAIAISSFCALPISITSTIFLTLTSMQHTQTSGDGTLGYLYWPAALIMAMMMTICSPIGAYLTHYFAIQTIRKLFAVVLFIVGFKMLLNI